MHAKSTKLKLAGRWSQQSLPAVAVTTFLMIRACRIFWAEVESLGKKIPSFVTSVVTTMIDSTMSIIVGLSDPMLHWIRMLCSIRGRLIPRLMWPRRQGFPGCSHGVGCIYLQALTREWVAFILQFIGDAFLLPFKYFLLLFVFSIVVSGFHLLILCSPSGFPNADVGTRARPWRVFLYIRDN